MQLEGYTVAIPRSPLTFLLPLSALLLILVQSGCAGYTTKDAAPSIITQPSNQTVTTGQTAIFSVSASGAAPLSYQWNKNGMAISGATLSSYTTPAETTSGCGSRFTVTVSNSAGKAISDTAVLTVNAAASGAPLQIATSSLPLTEVGVEFQAGLSATGGVQPYRWSVVSGRLPPALSLSPNTGALTGTTSQEGQFDFGVQVSDSSSPNPQTAMKALLLSVVLALQIAPGGLPNGQVGVSYQASLSGSGGVPPYAWYIVGAPPSGLSLNTKSAAIAGTPAQAGTSTFTVALEDSAGYTTQKSSSITITTGGSPASSGIIITPSVPPAVNQGTAFQFKANATGTWSCSGTDSSGAATVCKGSINPLTGLYTAPSKVTAQQSAGGMQLLPNNHVFNTRIDSLPLRSDSSMLIAGAGTVNLSYGGSFPINYVNRSIPTESEAFYYTPADNGAFQIPAYPEAKIEGGWFTRTNGNIDHHLLTIDTTTGMFQEMYQYYPAGTNSACPTCTSQSGLRYSNSTYALPANGSTDAAGMYLMPLVLRVQEVEQAIATGSPINHALRMTLQNGYLHNAYLWPATASTNAGGGLNYYGERVRLKSSFNISGFSPIAQILLTQLKQYGLIIADGGPGWDIVSPDATKIPIAIFNAMAEIGGAGISPSNFEVVDESGLMLSPTSGETTTNREIITFTRTSDSAKASVEVVLTGVTVGLPNDILYIQAGVAAQQFTAFVQGGTNNTVTWSMSPSVGTLTSGGLYTAPTTSANIQTTTVTATSTDNTSVAAEMTIAIYPNGSIRILPAQSNKYDLFSIGNYTDSQGNVWYNGIAGDGSYGYDNGGSWPSTTDIKLYEIPIYGSAAADLRFDILVPNGTYKITGKFAETQGYAPGYKIFSIEANGTVFVPNLDVYVAAGGHNMPLDEVSTTTVTNGVLSYVLRPGPNNASNPNTNISALEIDPVPAQ